MNPETEIIITALLSAITSSGVMSLIIYLIQRHDKKREQQEENKSAQSRMLLGLGHDKIVYLTDKFVRRGAITLKEKRNLDFLSRPYFDMDGNGDARIGYDACNKLPVVSEDEAELLDAQLLRKEFGVETQ